MSLSTLPDLCLLAVFDRIPIQNVDTLGLACRRWSTLKPIAYKQRRSLTLIISQNCNFLEEHFEGHCKLQFANRITKCKSSASSVDENRYIAQYKSNVLEYSTLADVDSNWLISTLPNIVNLVIIHDGYHDDELRIHNETTQLITLLKHWSDRLKSLEYFQEEHTFEYNHALFDAINAMPVLKRLWLELEFGSGFDHSQIDLPVLAQLDQFYISWLFVDLTHTFQKYASVMNSDLKIANWKSQNSLLEKFCQFSHQLAKRFVQCDFNLDINLLKQFYQKFTSLTKVNCDISKVKLSQLCHCLSPLKNLDYLKLYRDWESSSANPFSAENELPSSSFAPLTSVRTLKLTFVVDSHLGLNSTHLSNIFPAVQWIYLDSFIGCCTICDIKYYEFREDRANVRYQSCFKKFKQPCQMLPKLEEIIYH